MKKIEIEVYIRSNDYWWDADGIQHNKYLARIKSEPACWGVSISTHSAIGNLMTAHPEKFNMEFTYPGKL